ncbi:xylulokinase, partial [Alicyclobacillaceae bacterium I2511]
MLGIDIGTSGTKAIAVNPDGRTLASATCTYDMQAPTSGWAEQRPEDWWQATVQAVRRVLTSLDAGAASESQSGGEYSHTRIAALSFSGQMHGLVPLDGQGQVVRPALIWCDLRSAPQAQWMEQEIGRDNIIAWTENPPLPNFTATKLLWMRQHEPQAFSRIAKILLPKDYVRYRMTGQFAMDAADASGTLLYDVAHRRWSVNMCHALDLPMTLLPDSCESTDVVGHLTAEAAALLGVAEGTPV